MPDRPPKSPANPTAKNSQLAPTEQDVWATANLYGALANTFGPTGGFGGVTGTGATASQAHNYVRTELPARGPATQGDLTADALTLLRVSQHG